MSSQSTGGMPAAPNEAENGLKPYHLIALLILAAMAWQTMHFYPLLPERMASHFDGAGRANGFSSRQFFFGLMWFIMLLLVFAFYLLPRLLFRISPQLINIPNREYWLVPERIQKAMGIMVNEMGWFGVAIMSFIVLTMQLALDANTQRAPMRSDVMWTALVAFLAYTIYWCVRLYRRMAIPKSVG